MTLKINGVPYANTGLQMIGDKAYTVTIERGKSVKKLLWS